MIFKFNIIFQESRINENMIFAQTNIPLNTVTGLIFDFLKYDIF